MGWTNTGKFFAAEASQAGQRGEARRQKVCQHLSNPSITTGWGLIPARCHMSVEFVVGSRLALRVFIRHFWLSFFHRNQHYKFQFYQDRERAWKPAKAEVASSLNIVIHF